MPYFRLWKQSIPRMTMKFRLKETGFYDQRFREILRAFLTGHNSVLHLFFRADSIRGYLEEEFEPFYQGFAFEGTGMGLGAKSHLFPSYIRGKRFEQYIHKLDPGHLYQYYVGLGWFLQIKYGFSAKQYDKWLSQLDPKYGPILFDGVGFKSALFHYKKNPEIIKRFSFFSADYQRVCYQGLGRALWFLSQFRIEQVFKETQRFPRKNKDDLFSGIGLAIAYSMFDNLPTVFTALRQCPLEYRSSLAQGICFGWEARRLQNRDYWEQMMNKFRRELSNKINSWVDIVQAAELKIEEFPPEKQYIRWMDETRIMIQPILEKELT